MVRANMFELTSLTSTFLFPHLPSCSTLPLSLETPRRQQHPWVHMPLRPWAKGTVFFFFFLFLFLFFSFSDVERFSGVMHMSNAHATFAMATTGQLSRGYRVSTAHNADVVATSPGHATP